MRAKELPGRGSGFQKPELISGSSLKDASPIGAYERHDGYCGKEAGLPYFLPHYEHIPVHRLWRHTTFQVELSLSEHSHIIDCDECLAALRVCLQSESFESVVKQLERKSPSIARKVLSLHDHVPPHCLWAYATLQAELTLPEHEHIVDCDECRHTLRLCIQSESFAQVLKQLDWLGAEGEDRKYGT